MKEGAGRAVSEAPTWLFSLTALAPKAKKPSGDLPSHAFKVNGNCHELDLMTQWSHCEPDLGPNSVFLCILPVCALEQEAVRTLHVPGFKVRTPAFRAQ